MVEHLEGQFHGGRVLGGQEGLQHAHGQEEETIRLAGLKTESLDLLALGIVTVEQQTEEVLHLGLVAIFRVGQPETPLGQQLFKHVLGRLLRVEHHLVLGVVEVLGVFFQDLLAMCDYHRTTETLVISIEESLLHLVVLLAP